MEAALLRANVSAGMVIYEATNAASSEGGRSAYLIRDAVRSLWAALQAKRIEAIGKDMGPSARYRDIPSPEWHGLEAAEIKGWGWSSSIRSRDHTHGYDDVTLERAKVILLWPADVALSSTDQVEHASPKPTAADLYAVWVSAHEGKPPASEKEDWAYLKQTFPKMTRARAREIRRQHAPPEWRRKGRRGAKEIREI